MRSDDYYDDRHYLSREAYEQDQRDSEAWTRFWDAISRVTRPPGANIQTIQQVAALLGVTL